jgi:hypothetical protein
MLLGSMALVDRRGAQVDQRVVGGALVMKESSVVMETWCWCWAVEKVVAGAMGSSLLGSLNQTICNTSRSLPSGPTAQLSDAMES